MRFLALGIFALASAFGGTSPRALEIGDSISVRCASQLNAAGIAVDGSVGRQFTTGIYVAKYYRERHALPATVIIALGTNGDVSPSDIRNMMGELRGVAHVFYVTVHGPQAWDSHTNAVLRWARSAYRNVHLVQWNFTASQHPEWFYGDYLGVHPNYAGCIAYGHLVDATLRASHV